MDHAAEDQQGSSAPQQQQSGQPHQQLQQQLGQPGAGATGASGPGGPQQGLESQVGGAQPGQGYHVGQQQHHHHQQQQQQQRAEPYPPVQPQQQLVGDAAVAAAAAAGYPVYQQNPNYAPQPPVPQQYAQAQPQQPPPQQQQIPPQQQQQQQVAPQQPVYVMGRLPSERPIVKLSLNLIDTYKRINKIYYEERDARRRARAAAQGKELDVSGTGVHNHGWDDENYDYILTSGELFNGRYIIKERIGKGSFGQVVRAVDKETNRDVAIKIIKSKKPFLMQAKTEVELLVHLVKNDKRDENNIVRLLAHFVYRNHQCLVFEMLSLNLYELLKNTQFSGVSLNLIRKFAKQILKALAFLAKPEVDVIHCDLKPENILLRHPKRSGIKIIDFGSSCRSDRRMYSYIQSRFYRSPEVMLGLPYSVAIDMWSLGCILVEMHTGEPLFSGSDQFDQMQKIIKVLGMIPDSMLNQAGDQHRLQFFHHAETESGEKEWQLKLSRTKIASTGSSQQGSSPKEKPVIPSLNPRASLSEVIGAETSKKKKHQPPDAAQSVATYESFVDLIYKMLTYDPKERITPEQALQHPFIVSGDGSAARKPPPTAEGSTGDSKQSASMSS